MFVRFASEYSTIDHGIAITGLGSCILETKDTATRDITRDRRLKDRKKERER